MTINELITAPFLVIGYDHWKEGPGADIFNVPDVYTSFKHIFVAMLCHDFFFYHFHRYGTLTIVSIKTRTTQKNLSR